MGRGVSETCFGVCCGPPCLRTLGPSPQCPPLPHNWWCPELGEHRGPQGRGDPKQRGDAPPKSRGASPRWINACSGLGATFPCPGGLFVHVGAMPPQFGVGVPPPSGCCPLSPSGSDPSARLRPQQPRLREGTAPAGGHLGVPTMGLGGTCCLPSPPAGLSLLGCPAFWGCSRSPRLPLFRQRRRGPRHFLPQGTAAVGPYPHPPRPTPTETAPGGGDRDTVGGILQKSPGCQTRRGGVSCGVPEGSRSAESERRAAVSSVLLLPPSSQLCAPHRAPPRALPGHPQPSWVPPSPAELLGATITPWCHRHPQPSCVPFGDLERSERRGCAGGAPMGTGGRSPPRPQGMEEGRERWLRRGHCSGLCPLLVLARGSVHPLEALGVPLRSPCGAARAADVFLGVGEPQGVSGAFAASPLGVLGN